MPGGFEFSPMPTARGCPRAGGAEFLSAVAQGATAGQGPAAFPSPGDSGCRLGPKPRGFPLRRVARGALVPMARSLPLPVAGGCPLAGGSGSPQARGLRCPVAGWLRVSPCQRLGGARCRVARGRPRAAWRRVSSSPVAPDFLLGPKAPGFALCRWLRVSSDQRPENSLCRVAPGVFQAVT